MQSEKIYLHAEVDGQGNVAVRDQHGRELAGVLGVRISINVDDAARLELRVIDMVGKKAWTPGRANPVSPPSPVYGK
ncbi:hypothetical protein [Castellaniella sp.]|uniref:hypothetical protein n=1 Tax=Castellaniella sp. TaxID=1955812 RepID=UPI002AFE383A|nr:hypothetical protein [Castellaniella sp.]